jgi:hypothetical protein
LNALQSVTRESVRGFVKISTRAQDAANSGGQLEVRIVECGSRTLGLQVDHAEDRILAADGRGQHAVRRAEDRDSFAPRLGHDRAFGGHGMRRSIAVARQLFELMRNF